MYILSRFFPWFLCIDNAIKIYYCHMTVVTYKETPDCLKIHVALHFSLHIKVK